MVWHSLLTVGFQYKSLSLLLMHLLFVLVTSSHLTVLYILCCVSCSWCSALLRPDCHLPGSFSDNPVSDGAIRHFAPVAYLQKQTQWVQARLLSLIPLSLLRSPSDCGMFCAAVFVRTDNHNTFLLWKVRKINQFVKKEVIVQKEVQHTCTTSSPQAMWSALYCSLEFIPPYICDFFFFRRFEVFSFMFTIESKSDSTFLPHQRDIMLSD